MPLPLQTHPCTLLITVLSTKFCSVGLIDLVSYFFLFPQKYPHRIVGYDARGFSIKKNKQYGYSFKSHPYTVILTNRAIIHYKYLKLFSNIPKKVEDFVVQHKNGEDLTMNVVIGKYLREMGMSQCVGVHVKTEARALTNYSSEFFPFVLNVFDYASSIRYMHVLTIDLI